MPRSARISDSNAWYHVINRGISRRFIFLTDAHYLYFLDLLGIVSEKYAIEIHAFCLMGNHYHLLIYTPGNTVSRAIQYLNFRFATYFNSTRDRDGYVFKGRFKSIIIRNQRYLLNVCRYIHQNPVEAGLSKSAPLYEWSSCQDYLKDSARFDWLSRALWETPTQFFAHLNRPIPKKIRAIYSKLRLPNELV
jgi:REP element-mobilizing transposase RayT